MTDPLYNRLLAKNLYLYIDLQQSKEEIEHMIQASNVVEDASSQLFTGLILPEEYLDKVELTGVNMDQYTDEVIMNLEDFQKLYTG